MTRKLIVNNGQRERELVLVGTLVVGRDPMCDISDVDSLLSRRHAEFITGRDAVTVRDLGSRNGVFINGRRVAEGVVQPDDVVTIGHLQLHYVVQEALPVADIDTPDPDTTAYWPGGASADAAPPATLVAAPRQGMPAPAFDLSTGPFEAPRTRDSDVVPITSGGSTPAAIGPDQSLLLRLPAAEPYRSAPLVDPRPPRAATGSWRAFVFTRVALLSIIVCAAFLVPLFLQRGSGRPDDGNLWMAVPLVVALIATCGVGAVISSRAIQALTMFNEDVELAASGKLEAVGDRLGAKPARDLANTVNRMIGRLRDAAGPGSV